MSGHLALFVKRGATLRVAECVRLCESNRSAAKTTTSTKWNQCVIDLRITHLKTVVWWVLTSKGNELNDVFANGQLYFLHPNPFPPTIRPG